MIDHAAACARATGRKPFAHPGARRQFPPDRDFDLRHLRVEIDLDFASRSFRARTTQTFAPLGPDRRSLTLHAVELAIESVVGEKDKPLAFQHQGGRLRIELPRAYAEGEAFEVTIAYSGRPRAGLWFVGPDAGYPDKPQQAWSQGEQEDTRLWIPTWDYPNDRTTSEILATVPAGHAALSNGRLVETRTSPDGRSRTFHWLQEGDHVPYLVTLVAGDFDVRTERAPSGVPLEYWVPRGRAGDIPLALGNTARMLEFFAEWTGVAYPWAKYAQAVVHDFTFGGMENTSATTLTDRCLHGERARPDYQADWLVMHELAHQWFGDLVTCRSWEHVWLNEGFATLSEVLWREHAEGQDEADQNRLDKADRYFAEDRDSYRRPIVERTWTEAGELFDRHTYEKASLVLHMLRRVLGEAGFRKGVRLYLERHRHGLVETSDLRRAMEDATGRSLQWFFDQWLEGAGHPELRCETRWDERAGLVEVRIQQTQDVTDGMTPVFRLPLAIRVWGADEPRDHQVEVRERDQTFFLPAPQRPLAVTIDPGSHVLKSLEFERPVEALEVELRRSPAAIDRSLAARALATSAHPRAVELLGQAASGDPFWGVRAQAARALGKTRLEAALEPLLRALADPDSRVRRAAAEGLGELRDPRGAPALAAVLRDDPRDYPRAEAARALGVLRAEGARAALEAALAHDSHQDIIRWKAFEGFGELGDKQTIPLLGEWSAYGRPPRARESAIRALGKLGKDEREVRERLEALVARDPYIWARQAAIEALGELGDDKALPVLERAARVELDSRLTRAAREAAMKLRAGPKDSEALRREIEALRAEGRRLEGWVHGLKAMVEERK